MKVTSINEFNILELIGSEPLNLYGLPTNLLRPISSMCGSPTHELAKWLVKLLNYIRNKLFKFYLKDKFELVDFLDGINIQEKTKHSFDVNSSFTNLSLMRTIDFLCNHTDWCRSQLIKKT